MILSRQMGFKVILFLAWIAFTAAHALEIEAPPEIAEQVLAYSNEVAGTALAVDKNRSTILRVNIAKNVQCNTFTLKLMDKYSGKTIKNIERCSADLPNAVLQNAVLELFGHPVKNTDSGLSENIKTVLFGASFTAAGLLLYYSNPPKPVYGTQKLSEVRK